MRLHELHVISDLHMGGSSRREQVFNQAEALCAFVDSLAGRRPKGVQGLCINGDIVDFLASPNATYLDTKNSVEKLEALFDHESFAPVWRSLAGFVREQGRRLVLVLGNHDVELALPAVRERLVEELAGKDEAARGRLVFAVDGTGFACQVGSARVLCLHGNEVDSFNALDYNALRHVASALNRGHLDPHWTPNAGTRLVVDLMNGVKQNHAWVDLLKPETRPVFGLLAAVEPGYLMRAARLAPVLTRLAWDSARLAAGFLGEEDSVSEPRQRAENGESLEVVLGRTFSEAESSRSRHVLRDVISTYPEEEDPLDIVGIAEDNDYLGLGGALIDVLRNRDPKDNVREALLEWLREDRTFDLDFPDKAFKAITALVGPGIDFVIAGHTHLQRALPLPSGGMYYNTGTWMRLINISKEMLEKSRWDSVWAALKDGRLQVLDERQIAHNVRSVASIEHRPEGVLGTLSEVNLVDGKWVPVAIDESRHLVQ